MPALVIGIGGGSASGKSAVAEKLKQRLTPLRVEVINQDRFFWDKDRLPLHADPSGNRTWPDYNHPDSFDFASLRVALRAAREGEADVIILEGILALHDPELRELMDLRLFVEAEADERIVRRIRRNLARGHDLDRVCDFYLDSVRYRHQQYCQPTRAHADLVIPGGQDEWEQANRMLEEVCRRVRARVAAPGDSAASQGRAAGRG